MAVNLNGITYYKLDSLLHGYEGDVTKNCGLRGEEIDGNFNFLRGNDVKEVFYNDNNDLVIKKYNNEELIASKSNEHDYDFIYDAENGTLTIKNPNGEDINISGLNNIIYHDNTLDGTGEKDKPLTISNSSRTGRFLPAKKIINFTIEEQLPTEGIELHDRYVTKECDMISDENDVIVDNIINYYINDWDGEKWVAHKLNEGESIVLFESENGNMHEWMIIGGEFTDVTIELKKEILNIDLECEHIKYNDNGIYFDGYFGQF